MYVINFCPLTDIPYVEKFLANGVQFAKFFRANSHKYSEITEDLPADSPKFSSPFASSVMIRQYFPTYGITYFWVAKLFTSLVIIS